MRNRVKKKCHPKGCAKDAEKESKTKKEGKKDGKKKKEGKKETTER